MTDNKESLCVYCGKFLLWNNDKIFNYINPMTGSIIGSYCSKECLMKDNGLKEEGLEASIVDEDWYLQNSQLDTNIPYLSNTVNPNVLPIALIKAAYPDCKVKFVTADLKHAKEITIYNNKD